ncbi:fungal-specific transcription factor domain-containing protein [Fusarium redolens]|uniref:Fungal-specific transcription factor domain-containing protein n=1 Tax=Fusarium redolens TaxID=48865 RepID=A0A9P9HAV3_FUSRE|nr:fungal-specific transcription factor domain-containing protein [Fusarium redolens]KAH7254161.1 fungal-specific transcription factor domain-containing protein [Fusarium redolens]
MEIITPQDYQNNARKRQRRSLRPCDACRKRKTRCVTKDGDGDCVHCQLRATPCTFQHDPPERQVASGSGSSGISGPNSNTVSLQQPQDDISHEEQSQTSARSMSQSRKESRDDVQSVHSVSSVQAFLSPAETRASADSGIPLAPPSVMVPELGPLDRTMGCSSTRFAELYGLGSDMEPILMRHRPYDPQTHEFSLDTHAIRRVLERDDGQEYPLTFHMARDEKAVEGDPTFSQVDAIESCVHPHGPSLVELFWRHVQPCYPILSKDPFTLAYSQSYRRIPAALLGAIYLSAIRWWTYDPELSIRNPPDAALLRRMLRSAIPASYHRPKLSSIQAALLLLQCQPEDPLNPDHTFQWGLTCQVLAIGQCLGLHLDASNWTIPQWERNVRKRLSWALFMQDRWTALAYGRPVHIHDDDWTVGDLTPGDFSDFDSEGHAAASASATGSVSSSVSVSGSDDDRRSIAATGMTQFIQMVRLTQILSVVYSNFYTARTCREQDTVILWEKARPLFEMLTNWYHSIPPTLQMNVIYQRKLCFHGYLHFSYYGVVMTLLRRLIRSTALPPRCSDDRVLSSIRQIALQTAQSAISFVISLRPDHLEAFWYFTSPYLFSLLGSFTTLLLVTSLSSQERHFWQETLNSYLWNLRMMSKSHQPMQYAVNRLEGAILRGLEHSLAVNLNEPLNDKVSPMMGNYSADVYEYTDFGDWDLAAGASGPYDLLSGLVIQPNPMMPQRDLG